MKAAGMRVGKTGLENKLDSEIIGDVGHKRYEVNAFGKRIKEVSIDQGKNGKSYKIPKRHWKSKNRKKLFKP